MSESDNVWWNLHYPVADNQSESSQNRPQSYRPLVLGNLDE